MQFERLIDLSHRIVPEEGQRPLHAKMVPPVGHDDYPKDHWYIMHEVAFLNHTATHVEVPYHVVEEGADMAEVPLSRFCGEAAILDLTGVPHGGLIDLATVQEAAAPAGGVKEGDIVCRFDFDRYYDQNEKPSAPSFAAEPIEWLVAQGMKLMGVDTGGIELPDSDPRAEGQFNHHQLMDRGIPLIENLANLAALSRPRVTVFAFPLAISRLESFPLRVVAAE